MSSLPKSVSVLAAVEAPLKVVRAAPDNGSHAQRFHICPVESPVSKTSGCGIFAMEEGVSMSSAAVADVQSSIRRPLEVTNLVLTVLTES